MSKAYAKNRYCHFWLRASSPVIGKTTWCGEDSIPDEGCTKPPLLSEFQEMEVSWDRLHDEGTPAQHHARVARFLRQNHVEGVVAHHVGDEMVRILETMKLSLILEATGDARTAVLAATA